MKTRSYPVKRTVSRRKGAPKSRPSRNRPGLFSRLQSQLLSPRRNRYRGETARDLVDSIRESVSASADYLRTRLFSVRRNRYRLARLRATVRLLKDVLDEFLTDNCPHLAASISYYTLFSLFPLTLVIISILAFLSMSEEVEQRVIEAISDFIPMSSEFIGKSTEGVSGYQGITSIIAIIFLLWGGSSVFNAIRKALNTAWGIKKPRPFLAERAVEIGMMFGAGLLLIISFGMTTALSVVEKQDLTLAGISFFHGNIFARAMLVLLTTGLSFVTFLFCFRFIPNTRVRWSDVWGGALLAAIGFEIAKQVFIWYAANFAHYDVVYGPVGTLMALLVWTYVSALIMLFCAKITSVYSRRRLSFYEDASRRNQQPKGPSAHLPHHHPGQANVSSHLPNSAPSHDIEHPPRPPREHRRSFDP